MFKIKNNEEFGVKLLFCKEESSGIDIKVEIIEKKKKILADLSVYLLKKNIHIQLLIEDDIIIEESTRIKLSKIAHSMKKKLIEKRENRMLCVTGSWGEVCDFPTIVIRDFKKYNDILDKANQQKLRKKITEIIENREMDYEEDSHYNHYYEHLGLIGEDGFRIAKILEELNIATYKKVKNEIYPTDVYCLYMNFGVLGILNYNGKEKFCFYLMEELEILGVSSVLI